MSSPIEIIGLYNYLRSVFATGYINEDYNDALSETLLSLPSCFVEHYKKNHSYHDWVLLSISLNYESEQLLLQLCSSYNHANKTKGDIVNLSFTGVFSYKTENLWEKFNIDYNDMSFLTSVSGMNLSTTDSENINDEACHRCCITLHNGTQISFYFSNILFSLKQP